MLWSLGPLDDRDVPSASRCNANHFRLKGVLAYGRLGVSRRRASFRSGKPDESLSKRALMHNINIEVWDATGNKKQVVELPADAIVNRVIAVLVDKMNLPRHSPDGQLMSYKFHHRSSGRQLLENESLLVAGVRDGDVLRLQPEITAGGTSP
jgi:hypothetical protein